jgi:hypothetical protein
MRISLAIIVGKEEVVNLPLDGSSTGRAKRWEGRLLGDGVKVNE